MSHRKLRSLFLFASLIAAALPLRAAIVIARSDEAMIRTAPAVVTGTVVESYARLDDRGDIETVTRIAVDEAIKGDVGDVVDVVQFGGHLNGRYQAQSGAPQYEVGARYLVVLDRNGRGLWTTFDLALGQFRFVTREGKELLVRDTREISGWTESRAPFIDVDRDAAAFLLFAREVAWQSAATATVLLPKPMVLDYNLQSVTQSAVSIWTGGASAMNDTVSASPASGDTKNLSDGESRVIADDPHGDIPGTFNGSGIIATAFYGCNSCATSMKNGESYVAIDTADVVVNDGVSSSTISSGDFLSTMVHEIGHTWGFRHSDKNATDSATCSAPLPCEFTSAIMRSLLVSGLNGALQTWDRNAANEVYGDGSATANTGTQYVSTLGATPARRPNGMSWRISQGSTCTAPTITAQPSPSSQTISAGQQVNFSVTATGTGPLTYQWYTGNPPSGPVAPGASTGQSYSDTPSSTTTYWVRVTNSCGHADSNAVTVTVNGSCIPASISAQPQNATISSGQFTSLSVVAAGSTPFSYQWYVGNPPNTSAPIQINGTNPTLTVNPSQTTTYWVKVTNACNTGGANSNAATVTVNQTCTPPSITNDPQDQQITSGTSTSLFVGYSGSTSTVQWYRGVQNDTSNPVGTGQSFITGPLTQTTQYWALLSNGCGTAKSRTVTVSVLTACVAPAIQSVDAAPKALAPGQMVTLTAQATGTSLQFQWYRGAAPDFSSPVAGATTAVATDTPLASTSYFVKVSNSCGSQNSASVAVTVGSTCAPPAISAVSDNTTISSNSSVTLTVTATGDPTLHYQWYRGDAGDVSNPVGIDSPSFTSPALFNDTKFWVKVSNACTPPASSRAVLVTVIPAKHRASRH